MFPIDGSTGGRPRLNSALPLLGRAQLQACHRRRCSAAKGAAQPGNTGQIRILKMASK